MRFEILLAPDASKALQKLPRTCPPRSTGRARAASPVRADKTSKSRIKRLRGLRQPQYRLRVNEIRVFYDVTETSVEILAIVDKQEAKAWLEEEGTTGESRGSRQS
jgi:mRNA interferase RelE/StbE